MRKIQPSFSFHDEVNWLFPQPSALQRVRFWGRVDEFEEKVFREVTLADETTTLLNEHHLFWNELDVDLDVASLEEPERFPLISKAS